jgi:hypothetical protein
VARRVEQVDRPLQQVGPRSGDPAYPLEDQPVENPVEGLVDGRDVLLGQLG